MKEYSRKRSFRKFKKRGRQNIKKQRGLKNKRSKMLRNKILRGGGGEGATGEGNKCSHDWSIDKLVEENCCVREGKILSMQDCSNHLTAVQDGGTPVEGRPGWYMFATSAESDEGMKPYYYNTETEKTTWDLPKTEGGLPLELEEGSEDEDEEMRAEVAAEEEEKKRQVEDLLRKKGEVEKLKGDNFATKKNSSEWEKLFAASLFVPYPLGLVIALCHGKPRIKTVMESDGYDSIAYDVAAWVNKRMRDSPSRKSETYAHPSLRPFFDKVSELDGDSESELENRKASTFNMAVVVERELDNFTEIKEAWPLFEDFVTSIISAGNIFLSTMNKSELITYIEENKKFTGVGSLNEKTIEELRIIAGEVNEGGQVSYPKMNPSSPLEFSELLILFDMTRNTLLKMMGGEAVEAEMNDNSPLGRALKEKSSKIATTLDELEKLKKKLMESDPSVYSEWKDGRINRLREICEDYIRERSGGGESSLQNEDGVAALKELFTAPFEGKKEKGKSRRPFTLSIEQGAKGGGVYFEWSKGSLFGHKGGPYSLPKYIGIEYDEESKLLKFSFSLKEGGKMESLAVKVLKDGEEEIDEERARFIAAAFSYFCETDSGIFSEMEASADDGTHRNVISGEQMARRTEKVTKAAWGAAAAAAQALFTGGGTSIQRRKRRKSNRRKNKKHKKKRSKKYKRYKRIKTIRC